MTDEQMRYPIGKFAPPASYSTGDISNWINVIKELPGKLKQVVTPLNELQLDTPYRAGGWTIRQVVHHLPDSHMNGLVRIKWAMTEDNPTIKPYLEAEWAMLPDYKLPVDPSMKMLEAIHIRMVTLFESFTDDDWNCTYHHPATNDTVPLKKLLALYAWHSRHHLAHITKTVKKF